MKSRGIVENTPTLEVICAVLFDLPGLNTWNLPTRYHDYNKIVWQHCQRIYWTGAISNKISSARHNVLLKYIDGISNDFGPKVLVNSSEHLFRGDFQTAILSAKVFLLTYRGSRWIPGSDLRRNHWPWKYKTTIEVTHMTAETSATSHFLSLSSCR